MRKKIKKIPKYNGGTPKVIDPNVLNSSMTGRFTTPTLKNTNPQMASLRQHSRAVGSGGFGAGSSGGGKVGVGNAGSAVSTGIGLLETATSGQDVTFANAAGSTLSGAATGLQMGGPVGAAVGAVVGLAAGTAGRKGSVDWENAEADYGSGWMKWFGPSKDEINEKVNIAENMILAKTDTERLRADYANRGYNPAPMVLVAEGGTIRQPVDALVSKGELIYNPVTKKLSKIPGSKGKANNNDDVYAELQEGDMVISNSPTMLMSNGKTPAQNLEGLVDNDKNMKAKEAIIKKVVNWQEANRTKPQEYTMYDEGTPKVRRRKKEKIEYVVWDGKFGYFDANGGFHDMSDVSNPNLPDSTYLGRYEYVDVPTKKVVSNQQSAATPVVTPIDWENMKRAEFVPQPIEREPNQTVSRTISSGWRKTPTQEQIDRFRFGENYEDVVKARNDYEDSIKIYGTSNNELDEVVITAPRKKSNTSQKKDVVKPVAKKSTSKIVPSQSVTSTHTPVVTTSTTQSPEDTVVRRPIDVEPTKKSSTVVPPTSDVVYGRDGSVRYDYNTPETTIKTTTTKGNKPSSTKTSKTTKKSWGSDWQDNLYRMAVLTQPLWDKAKAEPVNYVVPSYKYMPTGIDVSDQLRDIDQSYALGRYNLANLYPNTGAGMAAGLQAASNRAKQLAAIRQYQTNAQNELIGKNVGIYNTQQNAYADIMNSVYDKTAANRAAARNINRQNRAAALANYGQMLRDDRANKVERMKFAALTPAIKSTYEDGSAMDIYNLYHELFG